MSKRTNARNRSQNRQSSASTTKSKSKPSRSKSNSGFKNDEEIVNLIHQHNYEVIDSNGDGNCLFRSLSICLTGVETQHILLRQLIVLELSRAIQKALALKAELEEEDKKNGNKNINQDSDDDEEIIGGRRSRKGKKLSSIISLDTRQTTSIDSKLPVPDYHYFVLGDFAKYCSKMATISVWGGHLEIQAAANIFGITILVLQDKFPPIQVQPDKSLHTDTNIVLYLLYRGACHYDAVIPTDDRIPQLKQSQLDKLDDARETLEQLITKRHKLIRDISQFSLERLEPKECSWFLSTDGQLQLKNQKIKKDNNYSYKDDQDHITDDDDDDENQDNDEKDDDERVHLAPNEVHDTNNEQKQQTNITTSQKSKKKHTTTSIKSIHDSSMDGTNIDIHSTSVDVCGGRTTTSSTTTSSSSNINNAIPIIKFQFPLPLIDQQCSFDSFIHETTPITTTTTSHFTSSNQIEINNTTPITTIDNDDDDDIPPLEQEFAELTIQSTSPLTIINNNTKQQLTQQFSTILQDSSQIGLSVLVSHNNSPIFEYTHGLGSIEGNIPITLDTRFRMASISKQVTAIGIYNLIEQGQLTLDTPIITFFPQLPEAFYGITIQHLLQHSSGIEDYEELLTKYIEMTNNIGIDNKNIRLNDNDVIQIIQQFATQLYFIPGTSYRYSNTGYCLLSLIITIITKKSFDEYIHDVLFVQAGVPDACVLSSNTTILNRAYGYSYNLNTNELLLTDQSNTSTTQGDGGVYFSTNDYHQWVQFIITKYFTNDRFMNIFRTNAISIQTDTIQQQLTPFDTILYSFGFFFQYTDINKTNIILFHSGESIGFNNIIYIDIQHNFIISAFSNSNTSDYVSAIFHKLLLQFTPNTFHTLFNNSNMNLFNILANVYINTHRQIQFTTNSSINSSTATDINTSSTTITTPTIKTLSSINTTSLPIDNCDLIIPKLLFHFIPEQTQVEKKVVKTKVSKKASHGKSSKRDKKHKR